MWKHLTEEYKNSDLVKGFNDVSVYAYHTQDSEGLLLHYWALFDGHAGSGAAVVASRLLHHRILEHLQDVQYILWNSAVLPPTCYGEEPNHYQHHHQHLSPGGSQRALNRAASLRGAAGAPGSPSTPAPRFFTEKKVQHESLIIGAIENAFKDMVSIWDLLATLEPNQLPKRTKSGI